MAGPTTTSPNVSRVDRRFDVLRQKVEQEAGAVQQKAQEGLARKAVAQGSQGSGAFIKLGQQQDQALNTQKQNAISDVESQREMAQAQADEVQANRDFARSEREAGQGFAAQQALLGREFESGEAGKNRAFQSREALLARGFSEKLFDKDMDFKTMVHNDNWKQQNKAFNEQIKQWGQQFKLDERVSDFNMRMAEMTFNKKDLMENFESAAPLSVSKIAGGGGGAVGQGIRGFK